MKKNIVKLLALLLSATLVTGCHVKTNKNNNKPSEQSNSIIEVPSSNNYGDSGDNGNSNSNGGNNNSNPLPTEGIDSVIALFVDGLDVTVPALNEYGLEYEVYYYYAEQMYVISGGVTDTENTIEAEYLAEFTAETGLVSANDDTNYPVDEYGYLFSDTEANVVVNFYYDEGAFYFSIYRTDDLTGQLDVSDIDTNWYVDYINFEGYTLSEHFPATEIAVGLDLGEFEVTGIEEDEYPYYYEPAYVDTENDETYPAFIYLVLEGDQMQDYLDILEASGYSVRLSTQSYQTYDDNWDIVTVEYQQGTAYDADKNVYITMYLNSEGNTLVQYLNFQENFGDSALTTNTDWTEEEKALMTSKLGEVLPFMQFGEDYSLYLHTAEDDEDYDYLILEDSYFENLTGDYGTLLKAAGYEYDDETYYYPCYFKDNGTAYIEIFPDYEQGTGHYFEIYYEDSKITTVTVENGTHVLNQAFFGLTNGSTTYEDHTVVTSDGTTYKAQCASKNGIQIRSNNENSGIVGQKNGAHCVSIKVTFDSNTYDKRTLDIYASNTAFNISDMYGTTVTKVSSMNYDQSVTSTHVQTYTFTSNYSCIGIRSNNSAIYITSIEIIWG